MSKHDTKFQADASQIPKGYDRPDFNQMAQYGYGRTILREMTSDDPNVSNVTSAAIRTGMDVVYGESHDVMSSTMDNIISDIKNSPVGSIKGIALELPTELQSLFDPKTLSTISEEEFIYRFQEEGITTVINAAENMKMSGEITKDQHGFIEDLSSSYDIPTKGPRFERISSVYKMAVVANENNIPVYAADDNVRRAVAAVLIKADDPNIKISIEQFKDLFDEGLDDGSDMKFLVNSGVDIDAAGSLIIHRGYGHIYGDSYNGAENVNGMDDLLERKGRDVATVAVVSPYHKIFLDAVDTADFEVIVNEDGTEEVLNNDYQDNNHDDTSNFSIDSIFDDGPPPF